MKSLFFGVIDEGLIFPWPQPSHAETSTPPRSARQRAAVLPPAGSTRPRSTASSTSRDEVLAGLKDLGLFGMPIPTSTAGAGLIGHRIRPGHAGGGRARLERRASPLGAHQSIGMKGLLLFGSPELQARYLPRLATGRDGRRLRADRAGGRAATRPPSQTRAEPRGDGVRAQRVQDLDHQRRLRRPVHRLRPDLGAEEGVKPKITAFLVERGVGREERARRAQAGHPRQLHHRDLLRRRDGAGEQRAGRAGARASRWPWRCSTAAAWGWPPGCIGLCERAHQDGRRAVQRAAGVRAAHRRVRARQGQDRHDDGRHLGAGVHDVPDHGDGRRRRGRLLGRERHLQGVRQRDAAGGWSTRRCRSPRASGTWPTTRTSGCCATRASTSSSRGPTRSCARSSRFRGCRAPGARWSTSRGRCASRSRASAC